MLPFRLPFDSWWAALTAMPLVAARAALEAIVFNADRLGISLFSLIGWDLFRISEYLIIIGFGDNFPSLGKIVHIYLLGGPKVHSFQPRVRVIQYLRSCKSLSVYTKSIFSDKDGDAIASLLGLFVQTANENVAELEMIVGTVGDFERTRLLSHSIKGSSANYGAAKMKSIAAELEEACIEENSGKAAELFEEMKYQSQLTVEAVDEYVT